MTDGAAPARHPLEDQFLAVLAHELRNPLAPILHALQILRRTGQRSDITDVIERQVGQLVHLVDDLLDVSRSSQGKIELRRARVDLATIAADAAEAVRPMLGQSSLTLIVSRPPTPVWVHGDPVRLTQVITNLLNNAGKFTPAGGHVWVTVTGTCESAEMRVRDSGIGIAGDDLGRVFNLFTQLDTGLDRSRGGLGVGLTLARRLVELHGGTIEAASPGAQLGAEFIVRLPASDDSAPRA